MRHLRLRREKAKLKEEDETLKKQPATLRGSEVAVHRGQPPQLSGQGDVPDFERIYQWLLCRPLSPAQPKSPAANPADRCHPKQQPWNYGRSEYQGIAELD